MSQEILIKKLDESFVQFEGVEPGTAMELSERYSFRKATAQTDYRVKRGLWDGFIRLYNRRTHTLPYGLVYDAVQYLVQNEYKVRLDPALKTGEKVDREFLESVSKDVIKPHTKNIPIEAYDYQIDALENIISNGRTLNLAATSAGKSLILYMAARMYQLADGMEDKTILIVVPSIMLVEQLYADFDDYSTFKDSTWNVFNHCQKVSGKYTKELSKNIVITTWQSIKGIPRESLENVGALFVDEVHTVKGPVLKAFVESCRNCSIRHGLTGTFDGVECNEKEAIGLFGPIKKIVSAKELIDSGRATKVDVNVIVASYDERTKKRFWKEQDLVPNQKTNSGALRYNAELNFIHRLECRKEFILNILEETKGNSIVLFNRVEEYGVPLYEEMVKRTKKKKCFLIVGGVDGSVREEIRQLLETTEDCVVFATDKIMSTGVSIKNVHNGFIVSSSKAKIKILQTLGRFMRLHSSKEKAYIYDFVDRLDVRGKANSTMKHLEERLKFYRTEGHPVKFVPINLREKEGLGIHDTPLTF